jgi:hypothetical protein
MQNDPFAPKYGVGHNQPQPTQPLQYAGMPVGQPKKRLNILLIPLILAVLFLLGAIGFGIWAFMGMQDYKLNVQPKIDKAVAIAEEKTKTEKDKEFVEKEKSPVRTYKAPQTAGSLLITYPKTWSAFVEESDKNNELVNGYFHPSYVPAAESGTDFALRVEVVSQSYDQVLKQFEGKAKNGKVRISAYKAPKMASGLVGARVDGEINTGQQDSMVLFALRDKTIKVSTESAQFLSDFNNIVLANLTFEP